MAIPKCLRTRTETLTARTQLLRVPGKVVGDESGDEVVGVVVARLQTNGAVDTGLRNSIRQFFWLQEAEELIAVPLVHEQIPVPTALRDPERGIMGTPILLVVS